MYLLDTNVLSEFVRIQPNSGLMARLDLLDHRDCFASEVTLFELRYGAMLRKDHQVFWQNIFTRIVPAVSWLPLTREIHLLAADTAASLASAGQRIGNEDCWIAATAMEHELTLVTRNERHFQRIAGLRVVNWFT